MTAPQPSRNARVITLRLVPGGPEAITNGFGSLSPSTVVARVGITDSFVGGYFWLRNYGRKRDTKVQFPTPQMSKSQAPNSKEIPNTKHQNKPQAALTFRGLKFRWCSIFGA